MGDVSSFPRLANELALPLIYAPDREIEDGMEARVGLELGEAVHQRHLGRRRPAGDPDDEVGAIGERQEVAEVLVTAASLDRA